MLHGWIIGKRLLEKIYIFGLHEVVLKKIWLEEMFRKNIV